MKPMKRFKTFMLLNAYDKQIPQGKLTFLHTCMLHLEHRAKSSERKDRTLQTKPACEIF